LKRGCVVSHALLELSRLYCPINFNLAEHLPVVKYIVIVHVIVHTMMQFTKPRCVTSQTMSLPSLGAFAIAKPTQNAVTGWD